MLRALLCVCLLTAAGCRAPVDLAPNQQPEHESGVSTATAPADDATPSPENRVPIVWWTVPQFAPGAQSDAPWALDDVLEAFGQANPGLELDVRVRPAHGADGIARHALAAQRAAPAALPDLVALPLDVLADDELRSWVTARWDDMATEELQGLYPFAAASVNDVNGNAVALPFAVDVMHLASRSSDAVEAWSLVGSAGPAGPYILPYPEADRIVRLWETNLSRGWSTFSIAPGNLWDWREQNRSLELLGAYRSATAVFTVLTFTYTMPMPDIDPFVNTVVVLAEDHQGHEVSATDSWRVDVVHPMIEVTKTADATNAHVGETIIYTITVSVPDGCDVWMNGTVSDPELGWVESFFGLQPGCSVSWTIPYLVTEETPDPFTNTVHVDAYDHQRHLVTDDDSWTVDILHPEILVTKIGPEMADVGETITYYVNVTNTGDTPLYNVTVYDTLMGVIATYAEIAVGATMHITYTYVVPAGLGTLDNVVEAYGEDKEHKWADDTAEWSVFKYGTVTGYKYADLDLDMYMDDGSEPGLSMWLIVLSGTTYSGESVYRTRLTESNGYYEFKTVEAGEYTVSEVMLTGWVNIAPISSGTFAVGSGTTFACDFGNMPAGSISGYKWHDVDIDGVWDATEFGIPLWTIYLYGYDIDGNTVSLVTMTDEDGYYEFSGLMPGVYDVSEEMPAGWFASTDAMVHIDVSALLPFDVTDVNFGNAEYGRITGFKWLDAWMNGYRDGNEPYLPGWTIVLTGVADDGTIIGPLYAVTDANGAYAFDNLMPGVYTVTEVLQAGWYNVTPLSREVTLIDGAYAFQVDGRTVKSGTVPQGRSLVNSGLQFSACPGGMVDNLRVFTAAMARRVSSPASILSPRMGAGETTSNRPEKDPLRAPTSLISWTYGPGRSRFQMKLVSSDCRMRSRTPLAPGSW